MFTRLDLKAAYYQVPICPESSAKTTTLTNWGVFRYKRLAMGLKNSGATFQKMLDSILCGIDNCFAYIDDILIWSKDPTQHLSTVREVLARLSKNGLAISTDKCTFARKEFLGYHLDEFGISPLKRKVDAIIRYPAPHKQKALLGFLGGLNFYRRCLPNLGGETPAQVLQPLYSAATAKTTRKFKDVWVEDGLQTHFDKAKQLLAMACQLTHPNPALPLALTTDSSKYASGGVLKQLEGDTWRPIGFWSRHLPPPKQNWSTYRRETYAVQQALRHFADEIRGRHIVVYSDHKPLIQAFNSDNTNQHDQIAYNMIQEIAQWTSDLRHLPGKQIALADALSRPAGVPLGTAHQLPAIDALAAVELAFETVDHNALAKAQTTCPDVASHRQGRHPNSLQMADVEFCPNVFLYCDLLTGKARPLVPKEFRQLVFQAFHNMAHPGRKGTANKIASRYYWPNANKDICEWVNDCQSCQLVKIGRTFSPPTSPKPVTMPRFSDLEIDVVGPMPLSSGMRYLLTVLCRRTRWLEAIPMATATADSCCQAFIQQWIPKFGLPTKAWSDNGASFVANMWTKLHEKLGTLVQYTPPYHSASLGGVERQHRTLKSGLKTALLDMGNKYQNLWYDALPWVLLGQRSTLQPTLGTSPAQLVLGGCPKLPGDLVSQIDNPALDVTQLLANLQANAAQEPAQPDHHRDVPTYWPSSAQKATHVYLKRGKPTPLGPQFEGPLPILDRIGKSCLKILTGRWAGGQERHETVHWENCKPYVAKVGLPIAQRATRGRPRKHPQ